MTETDTEAEAAEVARLAKLVRAQLDAADARILDGGDGTLIVQLVEPIRVEEGERARLTVGRITVRYMREVRDAPNLLEAYADRIVSPRGAFDELLSDADYTAVIRATERQLGKFQEGGRPSSRS